ncbi:MAG: nucleoside-diphosphate sugar epimerase/dehydratase [Candidatus Acidiferrales bacterium]
MMLRRRTWFITFFQAMIVLGALLIAWLLRFDFTLPYRGLLLASAPILVVIRLIALRIFNLNRGWWHFSGVSEAIDILKAVTLGSLAFWVFMRTLGILSFPRSIYLLEWVLTAGFLAGARLLSRVLADSTLENAHASKRVILIGAGFAAQMVIREIEQPGSGFEALGCVDDDPTKLGIRIHGVPVLGRVEQLPELLPRHPANEVLIAVPSATGEQMQRFVECCHRARIPSRTVPALRDVLNGRVSIQQVREVRIEDLLGRDPVELDLDFVRRELEGKVVLVTGAAGSIGSELCRQIATYHPRRLVCVDQSETGIFYLQQELGMHRQDIFVVADVTDEARMRATFREHAPHVVFHAAAYKHVPIMERNVHEAVKNNVFGLLTLLGIAERNSCEKFVLISSDKAVNPTNVMGVTKRVGELILACRAATSMKCVSVRFGNVLGSNGSVVPLFQKQLRDNLPLTVTHPEIRRFFMTIKEAVALVLQAFTIGSHGEILVLDMGESMSILRLAKTLIHLSGKTEEQVPIHFTGLREGEKLYEELFFAHEEAHVTSRHKIKRVQGIPMEQAVLARRLEELRYSMTIDGANPIRKKLREIVPEYFAPSRREENQQTARPAVLRHVAGHT